MGVSESGSLGDLNQNDGISNGGAINMISNFGSYSLGSTEKNVKLLENKVQSDACPLQHDIGDGYKKKQGHGEENIQIMKKSGESDENCVRSSGKETSIRYSSHTAKVVLRNIQSHGISESGEKYKTLTWKEASTDKLWDGCLQLNSSVTVSTVAFFKSGEKMPDVKWSDTVEVKGKVKLEAFEKYIQDLPRSRNRGLMVVSLRWKEGSSKFGLAGMKKIANGYKEGDRVGFAQLSPAIDLYVCPRCETIITILAKHGFFKGKTAIEENKDSLIGCVVWRRNQLDHNSVEQKSERCPNQAATSNVSTSHLPPGSILEPCRRNYTALISTSKDRVKRDKCRIKYPLGLHNLSTSCSPLAAQSTWSVSLVPAAPKTPYLDPVSQQASVGQSSISESVKDKSGEEQQGRSLDLQRPVLVLLPDVVKQPSPILDNEDLPEFDFGTSCGSVSQVVANKESDSLTIDRKLSEKGFRNMNVSLPLIVPSIKSWPTSHDRRLESINHQGLPSDEMEKMPPQKKVCGLGSIPMLTSVVDRQNTVLRMPCSTLVAQPAKNLFDDDDDMPEWCPPHVSLKKQWVPVTNQSSNIHIHSNKPNSVLPFISAAAPNPFPSSACVAADHPTFSAQAPHFSGHRPVFTAKQAQARPTNLYKAEDPSYPPFRPDSCLVNGKMPGCQTWKDWTP